MSINPNKEIATLQDYIEIIGIPKEQLNNELAANRIKRWLLQATDQIDSMISGTNEIGKLYDWYDTLKDDNIIDKRKKYKIKKAICSWVECMVITGKFWANGIPDVTANINIDISSSSQDGFIENVRKDIIQDLVVLGLYNTTNFNLENSYNSTNEQGNCNGFVVIPKEALDDTYLKLEPQKALQGSLDIAGNDFNNGGNITGLWTGAKPYLRQYEIIESDIDLSKNNVKGSVPLSNKADMILDPIDSIYKYINQFGVEYFGGFTKDQTMYLLNRVFESSGIEWKEDINYVKGQQTFILIQTKKRSREVGNIVFYYSLIDNNKGNNPIDHPEAWLEIVNKDVPIQEIIDYLKPFIQEELNKMVPLEVEKQITEKSKNFNVEAPGEVLEFKNQEDFENYKTTFNIDDSYFEDVPDTSGGDVKLDGFNIFTKLNTFNMGILSNFIFSKELKLLGDSDNKVNYLYDVNNPNEPNNKILAVSNEAQTISDDRQLTTKKYVDDLIKLNIDTTRKEVPGKTFLGKQVYIQYFELTDVLLTQLIIAGVDKIVSISAFATNFSSTDQTNFFPLPFYSSNNNYLRIKLETSTGSLKIDKNWTEVKINKIYGFVEFTSLI